MTKLTVVAPSGRVLIMRLGDKILAIAKQRGMKLADLARAVGISYNALGEYTRRHSRRIPSATRGIALASALGVSVEWLFDDSQDMPPPPRIESPPFPIYPWPPDGITWDEVMLAIAAYAYQKSIDRFWEAGRGRARLASGNEELRSIRPDHFAGMEDAPSYIADQLKDLESAIQRVIAMYRHRGKGEPPEGPK